MLFQERLEGALILPKGVGVGRHWASVTSFSYCIYKRVEGEFIYTE